MSSFTTQVWREILDAPIGSTRLLGGVEYEKTQGWSGTTSWVGPKGQRLTNTEMYEASIR